MNCYASLLGRLAARPTRKPQHWTCRCPAHDDARPSAWAWVGSRTGALLIRCSRGCPFPAIAAAAGTTPADWFPPKDPREKRRMTERKIVGEYWYTDENGNRLFQVVRYDPKDFRVRRKDSAGGWVWDLEGVTPAPYNLHDIHVRQSQPVLVVEGERKAEAVRGLGLLATCNHGGAGKWPADYGRWFRGRRVAILPDNDPPGHAHASLVAGSLMLHSAASIRVVHLPVPEKGDVMDFFQSCYKATDEQKRKALLTYVRAAPEWVRAGADARGAAAA